VGVAAAVLVSCRSRRRYAASPVGRLLRSLLLSSGRSPLSSECEPARSPPFPNQRGLGRRGFNRPDCFKLYRQMVLSTVKVVQGAFLSVPFGTKEWKEYCPTDGNAPRSRERVALGGCPLDRHKRILGSWTREMIGVDTTKPNHRVSLSRRRFTMTHHRIRSVRQRPRLSVLLLLSMIIFNTLGS
jgi:hypothetical protein